MAIDSNTKARVVDSVNSVRAVYSEQVDGFVENVRWLASIVLAEAGGLVAYRQLIEAQTLSMGLTAVLVILAFAVLILICASKSARDNRRSAGVLARESLDTIVSWVSSTNMSDDDIMRNVGAEISNLDRRLDEEYRKLSKFELAGSTVILLGSVLAGVFVFGSELSSLFQGLKNLF